MVDVGRNIKKRRISFCTVCMNRLHHLRRTLPKNIEDNSGYEDVEFVVLNYNSMDNLDLWIKREMSAHLKSGILKYYKTTEPKSFHMSHSKNVVAKLASGDIVCNVDADNYTGSGFAEYINSAYETDMNIYMAVDRDIAQRDCYGRICLLKEDFMTLRGYDESMKGYGFEDYDLWSRLELLGRKRHYIKAPSFLSALTHGDEERLRNEPNNMGIEKIYIRYINHAVTELLYLFKNRTFSMGKMIINKLYNSESIDNLFDEYKNFTYKNRLHKDIWHTGNWSTKNDSITLHGSLGQRVSFPTYDRKSVAQETMSAKEFRPVNDRLDIENMLMFYSQINNRIIMQRNIDEQAISVNKASFGETILQ